MTNRKSYNPFYFIGRAFAGLFRNITVTLGAILVLVCCTVLIGSFFVLYRNIAVNFDDLSVMNEIVVFLDYDATKEDAQRIGDEIKSLRELGRLDVEYVSKEQGLRNLMESDPENAYLYEDIPEEDNPLADSFIITYDDSSKVQKIEYNLSQIEGVRKVNSRTSLAVRINRMKNVIVTVFLFFFIVLTAVSVFVIINTVRMTVFSRRSEIYIMRYIGATRSFIAAPFIIEGMIMGGVAACISYFVMKYISGYVSAAIVSELELIHLLEFSSYSHALLIGFLCIGLGAGIIGSVISIVKPLEA